MFHSLRGRMYIASFASGFLSLSLSFLFVFFFFSSLLPSNVLSNAITLQVPSFEHAPIQNFSQYTCITTTRKSAQLVCYANQRERRFHPLSPALYVCCGNTNELSTVYVEIGSNEREYGKKSSCATQRRNINEQE